MIAVTYRAIEIYFMRIIIARIYPLTDVGGITLVNGLLKRLLIFMKISDVVKLRRLLILCLLSGAFYALPANAVVWSTVRDTVYTNNDVFDCNECHSYLKTIAGNSSALASRHSAPSGANFDGANDAAAYANTTALLASPSVNVVYPDGQEDRIYERAASYVNSGLMPYDPTVDIAPGPPDGIIDDFVAAPDLDSTKMAAILNWALQGAPYAAATATTHTTVQGSDPTLVTGKTTATLKATVNTNVHSGTAVPGSHSFQYGTVASGTFGTTTTVVPRSSTSSAVIVQAISSGLACGTSYLYRARASNGNGTTNGTTRTFDTLDCSAPIIRYNGSTAGSSQSYTVSKGSTLTNGDFLISASDVDTTTTLDWTKTSDPLVGSASVSGTDTPNPTIGYTAPAVIPDPDTVSFNVQVQDETPASPYGIKTDSITINIQIVDNPPVIDQGDATNFGVIEDSSGNTIQFTATDVDGDPIIWSISSVPAGSISGVASGAGNNTYDITYAPVPDADTIGADSFTVRASDAAGFDEIVVTVNVTGTPDNPVANDDPNYIVLVNSTNTALNVLANDADVDTVDTRTLAAQSITGSQGGTITVNSPGTPNNTLNYTPAPNNTATETFTYVVTDSFGLTDSALVTVSHPDTDSDGVVDFIDNCPATSNAGQQDNDGDQVINQNTTADPAQSIGVSTPGGDACDIDDDNDGISDVDEALYPACLDPFNQADATQDCDGDGLNNITEINDGDPDTVPDVDSVGPVVIAPADVTVNAKGYVTSVDIGVASAGDGNDGSISIIKPIVDATLSACSELSSYPLKAPAFRPGAHVVRWTTCDKAGNISFDAQNVRVRPIINTTVGQTVGEGQVAVMKVWLNGPAAQYPVKVNYQAVAGIAGSSDHNANAGTITISQTDGEGNNPGLVGTLNINITDDGLAEDDEDFSISLSNANHAVLGAVKSHQMTIVGGDAQPVIDLAVLQAGIPTGPKVYGDAGNVVSVTATTTDVRPSTVPTFDWSMTHNALSPIAANISSAANISTLSIDLSGVPAGNYPVTVEVNDNGRATSASLLLSVIAASPDVADCDVSGTPDSNTDCDGDGIDNITEGVTDSDADGIADYLDDNRIVDPGAIQNQSGDPTNSYLLATDAGLRIRLGTTALTAGATGVLVSQQNIDEHGGQAGSAGLATADTYTNLGGYYDFEITGLNNIINTARVVIPLQSAILSGVQYRKYNGASWATFVENDLNSISSAKGELGVCPAPGSIEYTPGLTAFDFCVQLTLEDGGPNDADGVRNYAIRDPGGVALPPETVATPAAADGRLGTLHPALLLILVLPPLLLARRRASKIKILSADERR
jgi:hypothetical protein